MTLRMSLYINQTGQPGKEAVPGAWAFRLTAAGAGSGLPQEIPGVAEASGVKPSDKWSKL